VTGDTVRDADNIARLCGGSHIREDGTVSASAFKLRHGETFLSVNWLEYLRLPDRAAEIVEVRRVLMSKRTMGRTAKIAVLNVGEASRAITDHDKDLPQIAVLHMPETEAGKPQDPSHAGIYGLAEDDNTIPELLARAVA
jgi:hypothetical protein